MAYNLRDRKSLNVTKGSYVESDFDEDEIELIERPPAARRPTQNNNAGTSSSGKRSIEEIGIKKRRGKKKVVYQEEVAKKSILSWLINLFIVQKSELVWFVNKTDRLDQVNAQDAMRSGRIAANGMISCGCCSSLFTVEGFAVHAGSKTKTPYKHMVLADDHNNPIQTLFQCQIEAWEDREEKKRRAYKNIMPAEYGTDRHDDACIICDDGGNLICCDNCPSTYHPMCLYLKNIPQNEWHCPYCVCKHCARWNGALSKCTQCEKHYHSKCGGEELDMNAPTTLFCGNSCRMIYEGLKGMLGVKTDLQDGVSFTLLQCADKPLESGSEDGGYTRVQGNSKIAVAPMVRLHISTRKVWGSSLANGSSTSLVGNLSNLTRINYSGFYIAVLEKNDEVVCAATVRVHDKNLAEMPYIATSEEYRGQRMAHNLVNHIESVLRRLQVEKLVIPAVEELAGVWINKFGFSPVGDEQSKQELTRYNTVTFYTSVTVSQLGSGKKAGGTTAYMGRAEHLMQCSCDVQSAEDWLNSSVIMEAFEARALRMSVACAQSLSKFSNPEEVVRFIEKLQQDIPGKGVKRQLEILCNVYALYLVHKHLGDFVSTGCITPKQGALANEQLRSLYSQVRPNAIALVDAFNYTDHFSFMMKTTQEPHPQINTDLQYFYSTPLFYCLPFKSPYSKMH
ncbi:Zinc finger, PHD-type [Corchorus capsularis]|uniref:Zinc finger, PHD-type n=1 Tax=Corchorus capsularis TaxID=210143 RepID=A0A1R3GND2_COCAP|nr:Zinc finger, PHD-type [Corchorus capsularis]